MYIHLKTNCFEIHETIELEGEIEYLTKVVGDLSILINWQDNWTKNQQGYRRLEYIINLIYQTYISPLNNRIHILFMEHSPTQTLYLGHISKRIETIKIMLSD